METDELKNIWKTLADNKLVEKELAEENIERIISLESSNTVAKLNKKLKIDFATNGLSALFIVAATIFLSIFNKLHNHSLPTEAYIFLFLAFAFFVFKSINCSSKIKLIKLSSTLSTIKASLNSAKKAIEETSKTEKIITYFSFTAIVIFGNVLLNQHTDLANFHINSLQGYVLIFSILSLILMSFLEKIIFRKKYSGIINDIANSLLELEEK